MDLNGTLVHFQEALRALWLASFPNVVLKGLISEQWKEMGWQGPNPSTDFRYKSSFLLVKRFSFCNFRYNFGVLSHEY